jgi:hypothetical protein
MWVTNLKIALIGKDTDSLVRLLDNPPDFSLGYSTQEIEEVMCLLSEASILLHTLKDELVVSMEQMKRNISFIKSSQPQISSTLNIKS